MHIYDQLSRIKILKILYTLCCHFFTETRLVD